MATLHLSGQFDRIGTSTIIARVDGVELIKQAWTTTPPYYYPHKGDIVYFMTTIISTLVSKKIYIDNVSIDMPMGGWDGRMYIGNKVGGEFYGKFIEATKIFKPIDATDISVTYIGTLNLQTGVSFDKLSTYATDLTSYLKTKGIIQVSDLTSDAAIAEIKSFFSLSDDFDEMLPVWAITLKVSTEDLSEKKSSIVSALETEGITPLTIESTDSMLIVKRFFPPTSDDISKISSILSTSLNVDVSIIQETRTHIADVLSARNIAMKDVLTATGLRAVDDAIAPFKPPLPPEVQPPSITVPLPEELPPEFKPIPTPPTPEIPWRWIGIGILGLIAIPSIVYMATRKGGK